MADSYYPQEFISVSDPLEKTKKYIWLSDLEKQQNFPIDSKGDLMVPYFEERKEVFGMKMSKDQISADRQKRAKEHFKSQVLPEIGDKDARKHFAKKYNVKQGF